MITFQLFRPSLKPFELMLQELPIYHRWLSAEMVRKETRSV